MEIKQQNILVWTRARPVGRGFIVDTNKDVYIFGMLHPGVDIAQWYCAPLRFMCPAIDSGCGLIFFNLFITSLAICGFTIP